MSNSNKWIIITPTLCQGNVPAWFEQEKDEEERPMTFKSEKEAVKYMLEERISKLQHQLAELDADAISPEDVEFNEEDFIIPCTIWDDGVITTEEDDVLYDPKLI